MVQISISDISKNPSIIDKLDDVAEVLNKKTKKIKGIFVPVRYLNAFEGVLQEIEYAKFKERNSALCKNSNEDDTLLDGLENGY